MEECRGTSGPEEKRDYGGLVGDCFDTYEDRGSFITSEISLRRISVSRTASVSVLNTVLCTLKNNHNSISYIPW